MPVWVFLHGASSHLTGLAMYRHLRGPRWGARSTDHGRTAMGWTDQAWIHRLHDHGPGHGPDLSTPLAVYGPRGHTLGVALTVHSGECRALQNVKERKIHEHNQSNH